MRDLPSALGRFVIIALRLGIGLAGACSPAALAQDDEDGEVVRRGLIEDDVFATGRSVNIGATIEGDLFAAGGWVDVDAKVTDNLIAAGGMMDILGRTEGDLIAAGGVVDVTAAVGDNLVVTGAVVTVDGPVEGKLFASGGRLRVGRRADIAGDAWLAAASADIGGRIGGHTVIAGGNITLRGHIAGDVEVTALSLEVARSAEIEGRLTHFGPDPPDVADGARIAGEVVHRHQPEDEPARPARAPDWPPLLWLGIILGLGLIVDLALPQYVRRAEARLAKRPIACFGLGLAVLFVTPVLILILVVSVLGLAIGLAMIAAYGALLLLGPVIALFGVGDALGRLWPAATRTDARRRLIFVAALVLLGLLGWLPWVGTPILWLVIMLGLGAATWQLHDSLRASSPQSAPDEAA